MKSEIFLAVAILGIASLAYSAENGSSFNERLEHCRQILNDADPQYVQDALIQIEKSSSPELELQILEAVTAVYSEIVREYEIKDSKKKEWLLSMVQLNMAYLQLGGLHHDVASELNRLIIRKLKDHLPPDLLKNPAAFHSLE